jgi:hypothetical protein
LSRYQPSDAGRFEIQNSNYELMSLNIQQFFYMENGHRVIVWDFGSSIMWTFCHFAWEDSLLGLRCSVNTTRLQFQILVNGL